MSRYVLAVDIGGTKCAVSIVDISRDFPMIIAKKKFMTSRSYLEVMEELFATIDSLLFENQSLTIECIGISCGGPLDSKNGIIVGPPNLPEWKNVPIVELFEKKYAVPTSLENDANAGALAEWFWGAGKGKQNIVFCTFGTGMGAGLILNGSLYQGTNSLAGEIGHIRLAEDGPWGFDKNGSVEGFCSGGGIEKLGKMLSAKWLSEDKSTLLASNYAEIEYITTKKIAECAHTGDELSLKIFDILSEKLGETMSILIDLLNPELIILGSIYIRQEDLIKEKMEKIVACESIPASWDVTKIVKARLNENIGDYAATAIAKYAIEG